MDSCTIQLLILSRRRRSTVGSRQRYSHSSVKNGAWARRSRPSLCCARLFSSREPRGASCFLGATREEVKGGGAARRRGSGRGNYAMYGWVRGAIVLGLDPVRTSWGDIITYTCPVGQKEVLVTTGPPAAPSGPARRGAHLWAWSGPAACRRPAPWSPWFRRWPRRWWRGSRRTGPRRRRRPPARPSAGTQPSMRTPSGRWPHRPLGGEGGGGAGT